ncbi:type II toxin-antitoxin system HicA family toxin [uncultured Dialister sp.]|uniref:type II toxin-antitoxin system HicA family toxin n=1 Tax=uncultured Dialister sp. TaxID=278064 RepID=UPI0034572119
MRIIINTGAGDMKTSELIKILKSHGCVFVRSGGNHDMWYSPIHESSISYRPPFEGGQDRHG